jgi:hypothetical protein
MTRAASKALIAVLLLADCVGYSHKPNTHLSDAEKVQALSLFYQQSELENEELMWQIDYGQRTKNAPAWALANRETQKAHQATVSNQMQSLRKSLCESHHFSSSANCGIVLEQNVTPYEGIRLRLLDRGKP